LGGDDAGRWLAAFEPVLVKGRDEEGILDSGWIVIVQEHSGAEP
jgi:hypothetical protein